MVVKRDIILSIINHQENIVPSWTMAFFNVPTAKRLLGEDNVVTDFEPEENYHFGSATQDNRERNIRYSEAIDNFAIGVGKGEILPLDMVDLVNIWIKSLKEE